MSKKIADRTYLALKYLYLNSKDMQDEECIQDLKLSQPLAYAKEFCTIKLTTARRSGHSHALARLVNQYYRDDWAIINYNQRLSNHCYQNIRKYKMEKVNIYEPKSSESKILYMDGCTMSETILTTSFCFDKDLRGIELNGIIVDCACMFSQSKIDSIYDIGMACMKNSKYQFFIFVE